MIRFALSTLAALIAAAAIAFTAAALFFNSAACIGVALLAFLTAWAITGFVVSRTFAKWERRREQNAVWARRRRARC